MKEKDFASKVDSLERRALSGQLSRRDFVAGLLSLGVASGTALAMADRAAAAYGHQVRRREQLRRAYDYVIVGAGSAGSVLAARLSAKGAEVLLVEGGVGDASQPLVTDSSRWPLNIGGELDWAYPMTGQSGLANRAPVASAGKVLGGSGSINGMMWLRGDIRDYESWNASVGGGWEVDAFERAFARIENYLPQDDSSRGSGGPISVGRYADAHALTQPSLDAGLELGLPEIGLNEGGLLDGSGVTEVNIFPDGRRSGPAQGYLVPALGECSVTLLTEAVVEKLRIDGRRCRGLDVSWQGERYRFVARREVLLCAGAIGTPRLLMLSGVGDPAELRAVGVRPRHALRAVGKNLQDHVLLPSLLFAGGPELPSVPTLGGVSTFSYFGDGLLSGAPDLQLMVTQVPFFTRALLPGEGISIVPWFVKPESRGSMRLVSADPAVPVHVDPNYLATTRDIQRLSFGVEAALEIGASNALQGFVSGLYTPAELSTEADRMAFVSQTATTGLHYTSTCVAGSSPEDSVVDRDFKVWGLEGLRIVDASVMPEIAGVNTHAPTLQLAELAAERMGFV